MAQRRSTHKGDRAQIMTRPDRVVYEIVKREAAQRGIPPWASTWPMFFWLPMLATPPNSFVNSTRRFCRWRCRHTPACRWADVTFP